MIGLSLSFCVRDIAQGKVSLGEVEKIVAGTRIEKNYRWQNLKDSYRIGYRWGQPEFDILDTLLENNMVKQPRLVDGNYPRLTETGHWVESEEDIEWVYKRA